MKKNYMMRLAAVLLVLVLLSTCVISGTFAKYTTEKSATDSATVANWGITLSIEGDKAVYDDDKTNKDATVKVLTDALAAPGTYEKFTVKLTGTPEVAYKIKVNASLTLSNWEIDGTPYCPLVFTVGSTSYEKEDTESVSEFAARVVAAINTAICGESDGEATYNAGASVPTTANEVLIDWTWKFAGDDVKDTALGNAATKATISFALTVTVEQID